MKKLLIVVAALAVFAGQMLANPVDVNTAKDLGVKYLKNNVVVKMTLLICMFSTMKTAMWLSPLTTAHVLSWVMVMVLLM